MNLLSVAYNILKSEGGKLSLDVLTKLIISSKQLEIANPLDITPEKVGEIINTHGLNIWIEGNDALIKKKEISSIYLLFTQLSDTIRIETSNPELVALGLIFYKRITEERQIYSELGHLKLKDLSTINKNNNARASLIAEFQKISQSEILENSFDEILLQVRRLENYTIQLFLTRLSQEDFSVQSYSSNQFAQQFEKLSLTVDKLYGSNNELPLFTKELILALADRNDFKNVYIPCFQTSSLIASLNQLNKQEKGVLAEGINTLSLGHKRMSLFLYGLDSTTLQKNNALQNSISRPDSFDLIICHPPFGLKLSEDIGDTTNNYLQFGSSREAYLLYIQLLLSRLNPQGLGIIVIPNGFLNSTEQVAIAIRKYIVENDLLEMVISIPSGIYQSNFVSTSILVLNRKKISGKKGKLTFVNTASIYATALDESLIPSMAYNTIKDIDSLKNIEMVQQTVSNLDVKINEYNLHLPFYINSYLDKIESLKKEGVNVESLGNVVLNVNFSTYNGNKEFKIVTTKELSRNNKEPFLKTENLAFTNKAGGKILNQTSIILAKNGGKLNPTIFKYNNEPIVANHNLIVLVPNEELINPEYFVQILEHQIVKEQLNARLKGVAQQYYSLDDLKEILIPLPSLKEQLANIILSEKSLVTKLEKDLVDIADQKKETEYAILSALRHSFGQKPFDNYLNNIETYLKDSIQNNRIIN